MSSDKATGNSVVYDKDTCYLDWKISNLCEIIKNMPPSSNFLSIPFLLDKNLAAIKVSRSLTARKIYADFTIDDDFFDFDICRVSNGKLCIKEVCSMGFKRNDGSALGFNTARGGTHYIAVQKDEFILRLQEYVSNGDVIFFVKLSPKCTIVTTEQYYQSVPFESEDSHQPASNIYSKKNIGVDNLLRSLKDMHLDGRFCDVFLHVGDKLFGAHKCILSSRSEKFASKLRYERNTISLVDVSECWKPHLFREFLLYLYSGKINLSDKNVTDLYIVAKYYIVKHLAYSCVEYMKKKLNVDMFCDVIKLAVENNESELQKVSYEFFKRNTDKILKTEKWSSFSKTNTLLLKDLLRISAM